jgi:hypothetical protein
LHAPRFDLRHVLGWRLRLGHVVMTEPEPTALADGFVLMKVINRRETHHPSRLLIARDRDTTRATFVDPVVRWGGQPV